MRASPVPSSVEHVWNPHPGLWAAAIAVVIAAVEIASLVVGGLPIAAPHGSPTAPTASPQSAVRSAGETELSAARVSLSGGSGPGEVWTSLDYSPPSTRAYSAMVYDPSDGYVLLFGGESQSGKALNDTWTYSGGRWTQLEPTVAPAPRWGAAMAFDAADGYVVLYGGFNGTTVLSDTWKYLDGKWTALSPKHRPSPLTFASMASDTAAGYVVLFGGYNSTAGASGSTWEFRAGAWTQLKPAKHPLGRWMASFAYVPSDGKDLLFGGYNSTYAVLGDTWTFDNGTWTEVTPALSPSPRAGAAMAYQASGTDLVLFGGYNGTTYLSDTWVYYGSMWTKVSSAFHPADRVGAAMADGSNFTSPVLFGGVSRSGTLLDDTWNISGTVWTHVIVPLPVARANTMMAYDQADGYVVLFGGITPGYALLGDTWEFSGGIWTLLHPSVSPSARDEAVMTFDAADGYILLFGGHNNSGWLHDTWSFVGGQWTQVRIPAGNPVPDGRGYASMTYDAADGYVVLFGGYNTSIAGDLLGDTWTYLAGVWTQLSPSPAPSPRLMAQMTYDSEDGYVLLFGGFDYYDSAARTYLGYPDTWMFSAGVWTNLTASLTASPPIKGNAGFVDDTYDGYPVLWGGLVNSTSDSGLSTWVYTGGGWAKLSAVGNPSGDSYGMGIAFYPPENEIVMFGNGGVTWVF
jgi:hypothetical protein